MCGSLFVVVWCDFDVDCWLSVVVRGLFCALFRCGLFVVLFVVLLFVGVCCSLLGVSRLLLFVSCYVLFRIDF